MKVKVCKYY